MRICWRSVTHFIIFFSFQYSPAPVQLLLSMYPVTGSLLSHYKQEGLMKKCLLILWQCKIHQSLHLTLYNFDSRAPWLTYMNLLVFWMIDVRVSITASKWTCVHSFLLQLIQIFASWTISIVNFTPMWNWKGCSWAHERAKSPSCECLGGLVFRLQHVRSDFTPP